MKTQNDTYYTCMGGQVRPPCRTRHKTLETAEKCLERDQSKCKTHNGMTDRYIVFFNGADFEPLISMRIQND